jgi:hypothetical protein
MNPAWTLYAELAELTAIAAEHHCLESPNFNHSET